MKPLVEPLQFPPKRFQPPFGGEEIYSKRSISYPAFIPPHSRVQDSSDENELPRWTEDHINSVRLDAALKRKSKLEKSDGRKEVAGTSSWANDSAEVDWNWQVPRKALGASFGENFFLSHDPPRTH